MPNNKHIITHTVPKSAEGRYYGIPLPVPDGLERLTVRYSYSRTSGSQGRKGEASNVVDLGLADGHGRFLGWSGGARSEVFVGPYAATNGYKMTEIEPGEWQILVGAYRLPENGLPVRYEIEYTPHLGKRWLTGDLHMHSDASDGQHSVYRLAEMAQKRGLDFIAVSNHNNTAENLLLPVVSGVTLIPAVEWTHYKGHMNLFGVAEPFDNSFVANDESDMRRLLADAKRRGAVVSVNHPQCPFCPYIWESNDVFDMVEVWNGPMRKANMDGIAWWHDMLMAGRRLPLVGGSDFHRDKQLVRFAKPVTVAYAESHAAKDILDAVSMGHSFVTANQHGVRLDLRCGGKMMGDTATTEDGQTLRVSANGMRCGQRLQLITAQGVMKEWRGAVDEEITIAAGWRFAYLAVVRRLFGKNWVRAISNPVYFD